MPISIRIFKVLVIALWAIILNPKELFIGSAYSARATDAANPNGGKEDGERVELERSIASILAHPIFAPNRMPPVYAAVAAQEPQKPPEVEGRLAGVTIRPGVREALIAREGEHALVVREGDDLDGWKVFSIASNRVVIESRFGQRILETSGAKAGEGPRQIGRAINKRAPSKKVNASSAHQSQPASLSRSGTPLKGPRQIRVGQ